MDITKEAIKNHDELWPDYKSKATATDPELIEIFDNFAFDEVINHDDMDIRTRLMVILASTLGSHALTEYKMMVKGALNVGVTPIEIKEILYQSVPYVGLSKVINFVHTTNAVFAERGIELLLERQSTTTLKTRQDKGVAVQKEIFGDVIDKMYENSPEDLIHIQHYLSANCFGDYYTRDGLDIKIRELITLVFLIAMGGTESQIKGHMQGNANVGNGWQMLINVITQLLPHVGYPRTLNALNCLNEVLPENNQ